VSVLLGAEFNAHIFPKPQRSQPESAPVEEEKMVTAGKSDPGSNIKISRCPVSAPFSYPWC